MPEPPVVLMVTAPFGKPQLGWRLITYVAFKGLLLLISITFTKGQALELGLEMVTVYEPDAKPLRVDAVLNPSDHLNFKVSLAGTVKAIFPVEALQADGNTAGSSMMT